jgi:gamma-glutamylcysteine synthetase
VTCSFLVDPHLHFVCLCRFEKFVDYALDVPMYYVQKGKDYKKAGGLDFKVGTGWKVMKGNLSDRLER